MATLIVNHNLVVNHSIYSLVSEYLFIFSTEEEREMHLQLLMLLKLIKKGYGVY